MSTFLSFLAIAILSHGTVCASSIDSLAEDFDYTAQEYVATMFPFPEAISRYKVHQSMRPEGQKLGPKQLPCKGDSVFPSSPGQYTKDYYSDISFVYDASKVPADKKGKVQNGRKEGVLTSRELACKLPSAERSDGSRFCHMGRFGRYILISDFFQDQCGNHYRGFWENAYILDNFGMKNPMLNSLNEHAGTSSLGRSDNLYPNAELTSMEFEPGGTTDVPRSRFLFFIPATEKDMAAIENAVQKQAGPKGMYIQCDDGYFAVRSRGCKN